MSAPFIYWFRNDLRLGDNAGLRHANASGHPLIALYILDEETTDFRGMGGASRWWLHHSLKSLQDSLKTKKVPLILRRGKAEKIIRDLVKVLQPAGMAWGRRYAKAERISDELIKTWLHEQGIDAQSFNTSLLQEPWKNLNKSGEAFKVFTPFWRTCRSLPSP
ncbi:MAG: deoxyribodipyrimidine photo-lyase, partial [Pseudomonadota bacterium]